MHFRSLAVLALAGALFSMPALAQSGYYGPATLDASGKVKGSQIPAPTGSLLGGVKAGANVTIGSDGTLSSSGAVQSVAGRAGAITLSHSDITDWASTTASLLSPYQLSSGLAPSATTDTTNAANIISGILAAGRLPALSGDISSSAGSATTVLATVNSNPGTAGSSSTVPVLTTDGKGRVTAVSTVAVTPSAIGAASTGALSSEVSRATAAEAAITTTSIGAATTGALTAETTRATAAEGVTSTAAAAAQAIANAGVANAAAAQATANGAVQGAGGDASATTSVATGSPTARLLGARAADVVNVRDFGAKGDGQFATPAVTISGTALSVSSAIFASTDVGKYIVVAGAGPTPAGGPVETMPITSIGGGYASVPTCALTDSSGAGSLATCSAVMSLASATLVSGGSGCTGTNGAYPFMVLGAGQIGTPPSINATVTGGVVTALGSVSGQGFVSALPTTLSGAAIYGAGCSTPPTVNLSYGVGVVEATAVGSGYAPATTSAALSGGSPSTAAVLGVLGIGVPAQPLVTTIAGFTDAQHVTLAAAATTTLSAVSEKIFWATDDHVTIQNAINYAQPLRKNVYFPTGYFFLEGSLDPNAGDTTFFGAGENNSVLIGDTGTSLSQDSGYWQPIFKDTGVSISALRGRLQFSDMQFRGLMDFGRYNMGSALFELNFYTELSFSRVKVALGPWMAMQNEGNYRFSVQDSIFDTNMRDNARCRSCQNVIIKGNHFLHSDDDAVALHQANYVQGAGNLHDVIDVEGNEFEDTGGISILGARDTIVKGNILRRVKGDPIGVTLDPTEGINPMYAVVVSDNIVSDSMTRPPFSTALNAVINVQFLTPAPATAEPNFIPGSSYKNTMYSGPAWDYGLVNYTTGLQPVPVGVSLKIIHNTVQRTLPAVAAYSAWGFGPALSNVGFVNPPVIDAGLRPTYAAEAPVNAIGELIDGNNFDDATGCVNLVGNLASGATSIITVSHNTCFDDLQYGVSVFGTGSGGILRVENNDFDLDPYHLAPGRVWPHGSWTNTPNPTTQALYVNPGLDFILDGNTFEELYATYTSASPPRCGTQNVVRGNPFSGNTGNLTSYSSANYGVGIYPLLGGCFDVTNVGADASGVAASAFYALQFAHVTESATMPATGKYYQGEFVRSTGTSACGCLGWVRLTTGTGMVLGTDWQIVQQIQTPITATAAGTTQAAATVLTGLAATVAVPTNLFGVELPVMAPGTEYEVWNTDASNTLVVYPPSGISIGSGAVNAGVNVAAGASYRVKAISATSYRPS